MIKTLQKIVYFKRKKRQWTQSELARRAGLTQATLSRLENGEEKPQLVTLEKLADAFDVKIDEFFRDEKNQETSFNRYEIDEIARAILSGKRDLSREQNKTADQVASLMINKLRAHQLPGRKRVQTIRWKAPFRKIKLSILLSEQTLFQILNRTDKHFTTYLEK